MNNYTKEWAEKELKRLDKEYDKWSYKRDQKAKEYSRLHNEIGSLNDSLQKIEDDMDHYRKILKDEN